MTLHNKTVLFRVTYCSTKETFMCTALGTPVASNGLHAHNRYLIILRYSISKHNLVELWSPDANDTYSLMLDYSFSSIVDVRLHRQPSLKS